MVPTRLSMVFGVLLGPVLDRIMLGMIDETNVMCDMFCLVRCDTQWVILFLFTENLISVVLARFWLPTMVVRLLVSALQLQLVLGRLDWLKLCWLQSMM